MFFLIVQSSGNITQTEKQIGDRLLEIEEFCGYEGHTTERNARRDSSLKIFIKHITSINLANFIGYTCWARLAEIIKSAL